MFFVIIKVNYEVNFDVRRGGYKVDEFMTSKVTLTALMY